VRQHQLPYWDSRSWATAKLTGVPTVLSEDFNGKVSANPWQDENNGTPRHHGVESDWAKCSTHA
jgi:hypothetical protein